MRPLENWVTARRIQLLCYLYNLAEEVGFEPTRLLHLTVFKTDALNHSAILPIKKSPRNPEALLCAH